MKTYMNEEFAIFTMEAFEEVIEQKNLYLIENTNTRFALFKQYSKELVYVIVLGISISWNLFVIYMGYIMILAIKDPNDQNEMFQLKMIMTTFPFVWIISLL